MTRSERMALDLDMVQAPGRWPRWPLLPLVKRNADMADRTFTALLFASGEPTIYFGNIMMLPGGVDCKTWADVLGAMESKTYPSFEDLVAEFRVD